MKNPEIKIKNKYSNTEINIATYLLSIFIFFISYYFVKETLGYVFMFVILEISIIISKNYRSAGRYLIFYIILLAICSLFTLAIEKGCMSFFILFLGGSFYSTLKIMPMYILLIEITHIPTSNIIAGLKKIKLPSKFVIVFALMIRVLPTIREEYRKIRTSQKFRGVGVNMFEMIKHPIFSMEYTLIPLIIRMAKISEELALSLRVRGLRFNTKTTSIREISITKRDYLSLLVSLTGLVVVIIYKIKFGETAV